MLKPNFDILKNQFGIDYDRAVQFHRSSERCMCHVKHNLERMIKKVQKQCKVKLTGFSYIGNMDEKLIVISDSLQPDYKKPQDPPEEKSESELSVDINDVRS